MKALEHLQGISADDCRRLRQQRILHTNQFLHAATLDIDRSRLSAKTGISPERLLELANQCALLEVSGLDRYVAVVRRLGVTNLKQLAAREPHELLDELVAALGWGQSPTLSDVQYWISQARLIDVMEPEEPSRRRVEVT